MIAVVDYGAGNLRNVRKALEHIGAHVLVTSDPSALEHAEKIVLPGVGAFADCRQGLIDRNLFEPLRALAQNGKPLLGICVGMQLLFEVGEEMGEWPGLGLIRGRVVRFEGAAFQGHNALKVPHIGWNQLHIVQPTHAFVRHIAEGSYAYFVHSYHAHVEEPACVLATAHYGYDFPAVVAKGNVWGVQFHPEKSQEVGLRFLRNFVFGET
ncbi:MAG: imidazole glycerol phosphate synthase subunit HisH [Thermoflexales bacterium]|nr:imidazole glycerol phosphate synthase subunit HisH [Thermoflexales bacterium]MCS7324579.1 imidazole glycerol phosphate synthase subunit HisH [Thermoflexales bacterium]MCX7939509.1 imidazole glycerol phosphate synthase subunit HisH [Thermoflexales bacterium]MDW8054983.1 imidazole glycerol phosphate synthase subunit HisH [Anaerolineae bacterium]MDW8293387.1 imidazole glycerol phosphate synthase subunit HisH [Anaerolineae bacterium]